MSLKTHLVAFCFTTWCLLGSYATVHQCSQLRAVNFTSSVPIQVSIYHKCHLYRTKFFSVSGPAHAGVSGQSNNPAVVGQGVFATASFATFKMRKDVELWEICFTMLQKVPKAYNKVNIWSTSKSAYKENIRKTLFFSALCNVLSAFLSVICYHLMAVRS